MQRQQDLGAIARTIVEGNMYMVLGTADASGRPWVSPVYFASAGYTEFYWVSSPEATHFRNISARPQIGIVIFDSQTPIGTGQGVYMSASAEELSGADIDRGIEVYARPPSAMEAGSGGARTWWRPLRIACIARPFRNTPSSTLRSARTVARRSPSERGGDR